MELAQILQWEALIQAGVMLGIKSWNVIRAAMLDAGVDSDDPAIEELHGKWDVLVADIARAAGK